MKFETSKMICAATTVALSVLMAVDAAAAKIPTDEECKAVRAKLTELTADDYKALKSKEKTNEQLGDALLGYAENEKTEAGRFTLLQDAFLQFVLGRAFDKAANTYDKAQADGGTEYALEVVAPAKNKLVSVATSKYPGAKSLKVRIETDAKSLRRVLTVRRQLKEKPGDESLSEQLGVEYAAIGNWDAALAAFLTAPGQVAKIADWELNDGKGADFTAAKVAAFWWKFAGDFTKRQNVEESVKLHAAVWYRIALDKDAFDGNEKTIVEKRIAETERFGAAARQERELAAMKMATLDPIRLEFSKDNVVELIGCPPGEFEMGCSEDKKSSQYKHKVKITRPFWMSKFQVTHRVWNDFRKVGKFSDRELVLGGWNRVHNVSPAAAQDFFEWLNRRTNFKKLVPKGYVFRLPTDAEWEYALNANEADAENLYMRWKNRRLADPGAIVVSFSDAQKRDVKKILPKSIWEFSGMEVGTKLPNAWGFHDMLGNMQELTLDTFDVNLLTGKETRLVNEQTAIRYADVETDPLRYFGGDTRAWIRRGGEYWNGGWGRDWFYKERIQANEWSVTFRIALGPDLMKEKGFLDKSKKKR